MVRPDVLSFPVQDKFGLYAAPCSFIFSIWLRWVSTPGNYQHILVTAVGTLPVSERNHNHLHGGVFCVIVVDKREMNKGTENLRVSSALSYCLFSAPTQTDNEPFCLIYLYA